MKPSLAHLFYQKLVRAFVANQCKQGLSDKDELIQQMEEVLSAHFSSQTFDVPLRTLSLSSVSDEQGIEHIDLLKINVEKSEFGVKRVGLHENFIDLGGDSIKAFRVINQIRVELHKDLPTTRPLTGSTVATLAEAVARQQRE